MNAAVLFSSKNIEVLFHSGSSRFIVVAFAPKNTVPDGSFFWLKEVAEKASLNCIGIMPRTSSWYPEHDMTLAMPALKVILTKFESVLSIGQSMGGYGALKYSRALGVSAVMAFAPQISIDPVDVGSFDRRFIKNFTPELNAGMRLTPSDLVPQPIIFYDPYDKEDREHAEQIAEVSGSAALVRAPWTAHFPILAFKGTSLMVEAINLALAHDVIALRKSIIDRRRGMPIRIKTVIGAAVRRNPELGAALLQRRANLLPPKMLDQLQQD
jgi:hypothetical protein